jgi:hypothetical protein
MTAMMRDLIVEIGLVIGVLAVEGRRRELGSRAFYQFPMLECSETQLGVESR